MREIRTEIEIAASPADVWRVLTDLASFSKWNPFVRSIEGALAEGERLRVRLAPPGSSGMTFRPTVLRVAEPREFRWLGHLLMPGLFDGEHIFELEDLGGKTRFVQREEFRGILAGPMLKALRDKTHRGFISMNQALRERVESGSGRSVG